jgi:flavin reductase
MLNAMASHPASNPNGLPPGAPSSLPKSDYRNAMARLGAAVNIITTDGPAGRAGFTASAVCSVTDEPPTLLVCLNRSASVYPAFKANGVLCVNVLAAGHQALSALFGGKTPMDERFAAGRWSRKTTGSPMLDDAAVSFDCRVVLAIGGAAEGLIYFDRRYHEIAAPPH